MMTCRFTLQELATAVDGSLGAIAPGTDAAAMVHGVSTDSRAITPGQLFVALEGERFDGHDFLAQVASLGAGAALVRAGREAPDLAIPQVSCADTRLALGRLAAHWRRRFSIPVFAVTGSNGKTTTKEMLTAILVADGGSERVLATRGNLNNDIGLPLTLLGLGADHRYAVVEMGMNHPGEIAYLTGIAAPTVALVTNAQRAHLEGLGSLEGVAREKGSIYGGLPPDGVAVINADDSHARLWWDLNPGRRIMDFSLGGQALVRGRAHVHGLETRLDLITPAGEAQVVLAVPGLHNARNALAAAAAALAADLPLAAVVAGLNGFTGVKGRLQQKTGPRGSVILDDTYNANPDSVRAGIDVLAATVGKKVLVLGDMGEIGVQSGQYHDEIGGYAKSMGVDRLFCLGEASRLAARNFGPGGDQFASRAALEKALLPELGPDVTVLVKGSRFMRMEQVVESLVAQAVPLAEQAEDKGGQPSCC